MATQVEILELCRQDSTFRVRQMRNARARTILFTLLSLVFAALTLSQALLSAQRPAPPWNQSIGFTLLGVGFAFMAWAYGRQWSVLKKMEGNGVSKSADTMR